MKVYSEEDFLMLSGIQHYAFCQRQWALIHIEKQWAENVRTVEGQFLHEKVDDPYIVETRGTLVIERAVPIVSHELGLYGIADMVEYIKTADLENSIKLEKQDGYWQPHPVEYKRGKAKSDNRDVMQLCAQAMCLEEAYGINIAFGSIYYAQTRRRVQIEFSSELKSSVKEMAVNMHQAFDKGLTPSAIMGANCKLCSLVELCVPKLTKKHKSASRYIEKALDELRTEV